MTEQILLTTQQASKATGFKPATLKKRRWAGQLPHFLKIGSRVFYDEKDIKAFMASCVRKSTSQTEPFPTQKGR